MMTENKCARNVISPVELSDLFHHDVFPIILDKLGPRDGRNLLRTSTPLYCDHKAGSKWMLDTHEYKIKTMEKELAQLDLLSSKCAKGERQMHNPLYVQEIILCNEMLRVMFRLQKMKACKTDLPIACDDDLDCLATDLHLEPVAPVDTRDRYGYGFDAPLCKAYNLVNANTM